MSSDRIVSGFALVVLRPATYLPPPYGIRRGAAGVFARPSGRALHLHAGALACRPFGDAAAVWDGALRAADFGHDNVAWSRPAPRRNTRRMALALIGGALFGAATTWFGGVLTRSGNARIDTVRASVPAAEPPAAPVQTAAAEVPVHALPPPPAVEPVRMTESSTPVAPPHQVHRDAAHARVDEPETPRAQPARTASASAPATVRSYAPRVARPGTRRAQAAPADQCDTDWPCGETLRSMRRELAQWEAARQRRALPESGDAGHVLGLGEHTRVTEW